LIVDDDETTRFILSQSIETLGYRVVTADDGADVPALLARERFDLLILDLYMPGMNGFELMRQIRHPPPGLLPLPKTPAAVPIVVVSGETDPDSVAHVKALGATAHLPKPVDLDQFDAVVRRTLMARRESKTRNKSVPSP
jgi:CheY-like chemotaxis protein